jgi:hypothetical protein
MYLGCDKDISLQVDHDAKGRGREHLVGQGLHEWLHRAHLLAVLGDGRNLNNKNRVDVHDVFEYVLDNNNNVLDMNVSFDTYFVKCVRQRVALNMLDGQT